MKRITIVALAACCTTAVFLKPVVAEDAEKINWNGARGKAKFDFLQMAQESVLPVERPKAKIVNFRLEAFPIDAIVKSIVNAPEAAPVGKQNVTVAELKELYSKRHFRLEVYPAQIDFINAVVVARDAGRKRIEQTVGHTVPRERIFEYSSKGQFGPEPTYSGYGIRDTAGKTVGYTLRYVISRSGETSISHWGPDFFVDLYYTANGNLLGIETERLYFLISSKAEPYYPDD